VKAGPAIELVLVDRARARRKHGWARLASHRLGQAEAVRQALAQAGQRQLWVVPHKESAAWLLQALSTHPSMRPHARLLLECEIDVEALSSLRAAFAAIVPRTQTCLGPDELLEVLGSDHPEDYCIAASVDGRGDHLVLHRGDFSVLVASVRSLAAAGEQAALDPRRLQLRDSGQTIALGGYEIAFEALLLERDAAYRRRANARRVDADASFGGCLRRLRRFKRVPRDGFPGLSAKTLARIERGEVDAPRAATLRTIARRLGVRPEEIGTY